MDAGFTEPFVEKQRQISLVADSAKLSSCHIAEVDISWMIDHY